LARVSSNEDPEQLERYLHARAELADAYARQEASPEEAEAHRREGRLLRLLIGMVLLIVVGGFAISIVGLLIFGGSAQ
jgi:hypothetical protein